MKTKRDATEAKKKLRRDAELKLSDKVGGEAGILLKDPMALVYELQVHQVELEMQNEELRRAWNEADELSARYRDLYDFAPISYFILDDKGVIADANLTAASLLGVERRSLSHQPFMNFLARGCIAPFKAFILEILISERKQTCQVELVRKGESTVHAIIEGIAVAASAGKGQEILLALLDITERKLAEARIATLNAELAARAAELEAANRELDTFNYTVAHDLRRPLTVINLLCQTLDELCTDSLDTTCRGYVRETYEGTVRMNRLIEALLDYSRLAHIELRREEFDLTALARTAATELKLAEPDRRVTFRIADGMRGEGDVSLLRVVLDNLFGNAWKFSATRDEAIIEFGQAEIHGEPTFFVRDNGAGFEMAVADRLFLPFQRLPGAEEAKGFGIGLATVDRIIRRHGGRVWAESEPGKGATFRFTLPEARSGHME